VRTSWDPNDKSATPEGVGVGNAILPGTELTYTIRFQNTGNAPAQNIFILDTLDANLDVSTLEILASSHTMVPTLLTGNIMRFSYSNINLPDSVNDEPNSHGYVTYSISPVSSIVNGSVINNTAAIYFDYNAPVITNTVFHTIDISLGILNNEKEEDGITIYPNPARNQIYVKLEENNRADISVYDVTGRNVLNKVLTISESIDVSMLRAGVYKLQIRQSEKIHRASIVIMR
jgi:uncharacterized repeat protein (TIGR01451 family)